MVVRPFALVGGGVAVSSEAGIGGRFLLSLRDGPPSCSIRSLLFTFKVYHRMFYPAEL